MIYYPVPLHQMKIFQGRYEKTSDLNASNRAAAEVLSLPIEPLMDQSSLKSIITILKLETIS